MSPAHRVSSLNHLLESEISPHRTRPCRSSIHASTRLSGHLSETSRPGGTFMLSRRVFLTLTGAAVAAPYNFFAESEAPSLLDHILLGTNDLESGIDFVEKSTGVRAQFGGVHPGRGTQNALLSLGERRYLEIIAPDPAQPDVKNPLAPELRSLKEPRLVGWAAHPDNISAFTDKLRARGVEFQGPTPGA